MNKLLSIILAVALLTGCAATYDGPTAEQSVCSRTITIHYGPNGEEEQIYSEEYTYDIYGSRVQTLSCRNGELFEKTVLRYDENGNCIRQRQYDISGLFPRKLADIRYEYDDRGRMVSHQDKLEPQYSWTCVYDDEARTMTCTYPHAVSISWFDEHGWAVRQETTFEDGTTSTIINEFRADGQRISTRYVESGGIALHSYTYDDLGRVLTVSETTPEGTELLFRYEYGEKYMIQYNADGSRITTNYNEDGSVHYFYHSDSTDHITQDGMYYYTTIRVPAKEVSP